MRDWLTPVRLALEATTDDVVFFVRDDDVGWDDDRLCVFLDRVTVHSLPLDLAVIPCALSPRLAEQLLAYDQAAAIEFHQHGYAHDNHEREGRQCEFGPTRATRSQLRDIQAGAVRLRSLLGPLVRPIFTPPWNRCTAETGKCLVELGFRVLSRDASAPPLNVPGLLELPISVDWFAQRKGVRLTRDELGGHLAASVAAGGAVGIMFHHARMDADELRAVDELLHLLAGHTRARCRPMLDVAVELARCRAERTGARAAPPTATGS